MAVAHIATADPAKAGGGDGYVGTGAGEVEASLGRGSLMMFVEAVQAFDVAVQAPDVVRVLRGTAERVIEPQVSAVDGFGFF